MDRPTPMVICADCGADWEHEPCDEGCPNDLDTASKDDAATLKRQPSS